MSESITITVGVPDKALSPNRKSRHWATKGKPRRKQREGAWASAVAMLDSGRDKPLWTRAHIEVRARLERKRGNGWDRDNFVGALKGVVDGFVDAGLLADDHGVEWGAVDITYGHSDPRVELTVRRLDASGGEAA